MERVSIIVPVYNTPEAYLRQCIESILEQEYEAFELILVDDGSQNNAGDICDEYQKGDKRIQVIHQRNHGVSAARNQGMQAASGNWICFADADDWIDSEMLNQSMKKIDGQDLDMVVWNLWLNYPEREVVRKSYPTAIYVKDDKSLEEIRLFLLRTIAIKKREIKIATLSNPVCHLYKSSIIRENGIIFDTSLKQGEDKLFNYQYYMHLHKFVYINQPLYHYRIHQESTTHTFFAEHVQTSTRILKKYYEIEPLIQTNNKYRNTYYIRVLYIAWFLIGRYYLQNGMSMSKAICEFAAMMRTEPYLTAAKEVRLSEMEFSMTKVRLKLLKLHMYGILFRDVRREQRLK